MSGATPSIILDPHERVRVAGPGDVERVIAVLEAAHADNGLFALDLEKVRRMVTLVLARPRPPEAPMAMIGLLVDQDGATLGLSVLLVTQFWYSSDWFLEELVNFVRPEARSPPRARALIDFAKGAADEIALPLQMTVLSTERTDAKVRLYRRHLEQVGGVFMHRPAPDAADAAEAA